MSQERFDAVLSRLARQLDLDDLPDLIHRGRINVAGTDVLLGCASDGSCRMVLDLGPLPERGGQAVLRRLLELNLRRAGDARLSLGVHPNSGHIVGIAHLAIETIEPEGALLRWLSRQVPNWVMRLEADLREAAPVADGRTVAEFPEALA